jgi:transcriptional regulator with XRE-family HTH domain
MQIMWYIMFMPAQAPEVVDPLAQRDLEALSSLVRTRRQSMKLAAQSVARAANMSRQTLNRIEHGEPSVTIGAYLNALRALGLELRVVTAERLSTTSEDAVRIDDYQQLKRIAWHRQGEMLTKREAFALYERNWRHIDQSTLDLSERNFIADLVKTYGKGVMLV